jgi:hypothetical protein
LNKIARKIEGFLAVESRLPTSTAAIRRDLIAVLNLAKGSTSSTASHPDVLPVLLKSLTELDDQIYFHEIFGAKHVRNVAIRAKWARVLAKLYISGIDSLGIADKCVLVRLLDSSNDRYIPPYDKFVLTTWIDIRDPYCTEQSLDTPVVSRASSRRASPLNVQSSSSSSSSVTSSRRRPTGSGS